MWVTGVASALACIAVSSILTMISTSIPSYRADVITLSNLRFGESFYELRALLNASLSIPYNKMFTTDVHSATFDLYYPDWYGRLSVIGHVEDVHQDKNKSSEPFWTMNPHTLFQQNDQFHYTIPLLSYARVLSRLLVQAIRQRGWISVPASGVTHVRATSFGYRFTLLIVCDTELNVLTLGVEGNNCILYRLSTGWTNRTAEVQELRSHVKSLKVNDTSGKVLNEQKGYIPIDETFSQLGMEENSFALTEIEAL